MARTRLWELLLTGAVAGAAGGALVWWLAPRGASSAAVGAAPEQADVADAEADDSAAQQDCVERIAKIETQMHAVRRTVARQAKVDAMTESSDGTETGRITVRADDPRFENAVKAIIDTAREEAEADEQERRDERFDQMVAHQTDELADLLKLNNDQASKLEVVLQDRSDTFRELRRGDQRPVTPKQWRDAMTKIREDTKRQLGEFLSAEQLKAYEEYEAENWGRRRGGR